jgi:hypothetical protein
MADLSLRRCREEEGRRPGSGPGKQQFRGKQEKRLRSQVEGNWLSKPARTESVDHLGRLEGHGAPAITTKARSKDLEEGWGRWGGPPVFRSESTNIPGDQKSRLQKGNNSW